MICCALEEPEISRAISPLRECSVATESAGSPGASFGSRLEIADDGAPTRRKKN